MDLAKIRKKSLQTHYEPDGGKCAASSCSIEPITMMAEAVTAPPTSTGADFCEEVKKSTPITFAVASPPVRPATVPELAAFCSPLEAIVAGRTAAGCDDETFLADEISGEVADVPCLEFLCFRVSDEIYGINIMDIKEIIKPREVTEIPRAPLFVSGVLSLRGTIIPVIDMRIRLGLTHVELTGKERIIVIKNKNSFSGLLVDEVIQVVQVQPEALETAPTVLDGIDREFIRGLARSDKRLIIILNLQNITDINLH